TLRRFCDESPARLAWLEEHGARFASTVCEYKTSYPTDRHYLYFSGNEKAHPYVEHATPAPRGHRQVAKGMSSGAVLFDALLRSAVNLGVEFGPVSRVEQLVVEDGMVRGVRFRTLPPQAPAFARHRRLAAGAVKLHNWVPAVGGRLAALTDRIWDEHAVEREARASAVILSAGGFIFDRDMVRQHAPRYAGVSPLGTAGDDGAGIRLGQSVGGSVDHLDRVTAWRFIAPPSALLEGVTVGVDGRRIASEDLYGATHAKVMVDEHGGRGFLIVDAATWRKARSQVKEQTQPFQKAQLASVLTTGHSRAKTLDELAAKIGVSATGLRATVEAYNTGLRDGSGDPARKDPTYCSPLETAPFYAIDISIRPSLSYFVPGLTLGGLRVEGSSGLVLDDAGVPIPHLYAAGRTAVGVCSSSYVSGLALADCVFSGKRAGEHAAAANATGGLSNVNGRRPTPAT
ncbi:MAG: pyridine nucleotide-disulfide oxidoreductase, partial [Aeromicrobium sp.]|nr:pyridine nucleotide-disulfide oxidoreductase [Aeromicrobium sp.]